MNRIEYLNNSLDEEEEFRDKSYSVSKIMNDKLQCSDDTNNIIESIRSNIKHDKQILDLYLLHIIDNYKQSEICREYNLNKDWLCNQFKIIKNKIKNQYKKEDFQ